MPLDADPFGERYGWVEDRYGHSSQRSYTSPEGEAQPLTILSPLFAGDIYGEADEASDYLSVSKDVTRGQRVRYPAGMDQDEEGMVMLQWRQIPTRVLWSSTA